METKYNLFRQYSL